MYASYSLNHYDGYTSHVSPSKDICQHQWKMHKHIVHITLHGNYTPL